jgi:dTDP-4-dehydrorhamnose 3,5-epimerase-like enzyme
MDSLDLQVLQQARVQVEGTAVEGVLVVRTPVFGDARGFFSELFHADALHRGEAHRDDGRLFQDGQRLGLQ